MRCGCAAALKGTAARERGSIFGSDRGGCRHATCKFGKFERKKRGKTARSMMHMRDKCRRKKKKRDVPECRLVAVCFPVDEV